MAGKKNSLKYWIGKIHLWLGLTSGLIVFIVSLTGCIFCFHDEIKDITRPWRFVEEQNKPYILPTVLKARAEQLVDSGAATYITYTARNRPAVAFTSAGSNYYYVYFNPYTGQHLKTENLRTDFFIIVEYIHLYLLLPAPIGKHIVGVSTIIFIVMLISGIVLWWPKRKTDRKRSFSIKWNGKWRRINYDLHNVLGFYAASITLILALTGLAIDYDWMGDAFYKTANLGRHYPAEKEEPKVDTLKKSYPGKQHAVDRAFIYTLSRHPEAEMYAVQAVAAKGQAISTSAYARSLNYDHQSNYYFDPVSGDLLKSLPYQAKSAGLKLNEMNYGIHTGQVMGLTGKIIAFLASLIATSLPVTGFTIWLGRKKKGKKKERHTKSIRHLQERKQRRRLVLPFKRISLPE